MIAFWSQYIILNNKKKTKSLIEKKKKKKTVAHWKKDKLFLNSSIQTRFRGNTETQKEKRSFHERKSKCMSMRRHRASLLCGTKCFLPGRPKKKQQETYIKLNR